MVCILVCDLQVGLVTMFVTSSWLASNVVVVGGWWVWVFRIIVASGCDFRCVTVVLGWLVVVFRCSLLLLSGGCDGC